MAVSISGAVDMLAGAAGALDGGGDAFELTIPPLASGALRVASFEGREGISKLFRFDVLAVGEAGVRARGLVGQPAKLEVRAPDGVARVVQGIVASIEQSSLRPHPDRHAYQIRLVPRMWLLKRRKTTRVFQGMSVREVVSAVLDGARVPYDWRLGRDYPKRAYCVQYQETDFDFVRRLLAEDGIFFFFEPPSALMDGLLGGAASAVAGVASAAGSMLGGAIGSAVAAVEDALGLSEKVVFGDHCKAYSPIAGGPALAVSADVDVSFSIGTDGVSAGASADVSVGASPHLRLRDALSMTAPDDDVYPFSLRDTLASNRSLARDYDFEHPLLELRGEASAGAAISASASASAEAGASLAIGGLVSIDLSASALASGSLSGAADLAIYSHRADYLEPDADVARATLILDQARARSVAGGGGSTCRRLSAGGTFTLDAERMPSLAGEYVVTWVVHEGRTPELAGHAEGKPLYSNRFEHVPASVVFRPKRRRRTLREVLETATVVGPEGAEIHTDEYGRIKVQFHWDLEGNDDDRSSCWLRLSQTWAGAAWGTQFIPRVGMEVLVTFLGGDEDCPVAIGCVSNATHPVPYLLPRDKTRSGIRTQSTPGGTGYNELSFEDAIQNEQIYVHAQRDMDTLIERNHTLQVRGAESHSVDGEQSTTVGGDQQLSVMGSRSETVTGEDRAVVCGNRSSEVQGDLRESVHGSASIAVSGGRAIQVDRDYSLSVGDGIDPAQSDQFVHGSASIGASERIVLRAERGISLIVGDTRIEIDEDGVRIEGGKLDLKAGESASMSGKGPSLSLGEDAEITSKSLRIYTEGATLEMDKNAKLKGDKLLLNCDLSQPMDGDDAAAPETQPFQVKLSNYYLAPYVGKKYHLSVQGLRFEGTTDEDGLVKEDIPKDAKQVVVTLWLDEYPTGRQRVYTLSLGETPPATTPRGAQLRLKHLGYFTGAPADDWSEEARAALREIQSDHAETHGLDVTGELDGPTIAMLEDVYGS